MAIKLGIAFYAQQDHRGRSTSPRWTLVAHSSAYSSHRGLRVFKIIYANSHWYTAHTQEVALQSEPGLLGVVHIAEINMTDAYLMRFISEFPAHPSGHTAWNCTSWIIGILRRLHAQGFLILPADFDERIEHKVARLTNTSWSSQFPVVPLVA